MIAMNANAKKFFALLLSALMVFTCFAGMITVSADDADKFAPTNEEKINLHDGGQSSALSSFGKGQSFGAMFTVEEGKRLTQINFHSLATYSNNNNHIVFKVYQWDTDYKTSVAGPVLAQKTVINHPDNDPLDVILPTNRNLTGELLFTATYVDGGNAMTPWTSDGTGAEGVIFFANGSPCATYCVDITVGDALTVEPATYTATFVADGNEVGKVTFLEGDTELVDIPAVPEKEGFWGDWASFTLGNSDITIEAVYTDASAAIPVEIPDATNVTAFAEDHLSYLRAEGCAVRVNRDGTVSFVGTWDVDKDVDAYATIEYYNMMRKHYVNWDGQNSIPNRSHKYNVIAIKVKAPAVCLDSNPNMSVLVGRNEEFYVDVTNTIKCDGNEEYWIFDFSKEADFTSDLINTIKINWAYSVGEESNLGAEFLVMGFQLFETLEDALTATGSEEATEAPTEAKTDAPETEAPTQAPETSGDNETQPTEEDMGCGSVIGFGAVAILAAAAAAVALKKKD